VEELLDAVLGRLEPRRFFVLHGIVREALAEPVEVPGVDEVVQAAYRSRVIPSSPPVRACSAILDADESAG
jgi:hypothetical protein